MKRISTFIAFLLAVVSLNAQKASPFFPEKDLMPLGIYYYPEHWSPTEWERDIKNISEMGFEFIHIAEFAWINMEPTEGNFDFVWLDKVIDLAAQHHLKVILGTPSCITPIWMTQKYPETLLMDARYQRAEHGTRANGSLSDSVYNRFCARIIAQMGKRYGSKANVWGWQLDNEPEAKADFSPAAQEAFRLWLKDKYQNIETLNTAWGNAFWGQTYSRFGQIQIPNAQLVGWWGTNPHALLDFKRFSADNQAKFLNMQAEVLRRYIAPTQFITSNYTASSYGADPRRAQKLDFASFTAYPNGGSHNIGSEGFRLGNNRTLSFAGDFFRPFHNTTGVMELQPGQVNWGNTNALLLPGTLRMWLYHSFAAGCSFACSYRYRQINYGAEQYHAGVIEPDGVTPSQGGKEYMQMAQEMKLLRKAWKPDNPMPAKLKAHKTALLWNYDNMWSLDNQRQTTQFDFRSFFQKYEELAKSLGAPVDILYENDDLSDYKVVIAPAYEMLDTALVQKWMRYVENGGNLVLTLRTGVKNRWGHIWRSGWAAPIYPLIDAKISNYDQLLPDGEGEITCQSNIYKWNNWADLLTANHPENVLASYSNQFYAGTAAVVKNKLGKGSVTYIGVDTDDAALERNILQQVYSQAGATTENYPEGVYVQWRSGFWVAVNYTSNNQTINIPDNARILIGEKTLKPAGVVVWTE
jgi:beta-galactosidase